MPPHCLFSAVGVPCSARREVAAINVSRRPFSLHFAEKSLTLPPNTGFRRFVNGEKTWRLADFLSYGAVLASMWRQTGVIVANVLKGAKPSDLPVEQPTKLELVVNAKTALSLGLPIPPNMLIRADEVIE